VTAKAYRCLSLQATVGLITDAVDTSVTITNIVLLLLLLLLAVAVYSSSSRKYDTFLKKYLNTSK